MSGKKGKGKGASADGDSGEASGGSSKGGTSIKVIILTSSIYIDAFYITRCDIFSVKNNRKYWKH